MEPYNIFDWTLKLDRDKYKYTQVIKWKVNHIGYI